MKNSDQLQLMYPDVIPPNSNLQRSADPLVPRKKIHANAAMPTVNEKGSSTKAEKPAPKEARLVFYSHLAAQNGPTIRVQRPGINMIVHPQIGESEELNDSLMKSMDFKLSDGKSDALQAKSFAGFAKTHSPQSKRFINFRQLFSKARPVLAKTRNKKIYLLIILMVILAVAVTYGVRESVNNSRRKALHERKHRLNGNNQRSKWECAVARYETKQNKHITRCKQGEIMRKRKIIPLIGLVVAVLLVTSGYSVVKHRHHVQAQAAAVSEQERTKQLSDWQEKVKMWDRQDTKKSTTVAPSDLKKPDVSVLPDTGPGDTLGLVVLVTFLSTVSYLFINKFIFKRYL